ncbi:MAG: hypothetical protein ACREQC_07395, partial [Candidatus Binataceae bacterium]
MVSSFVETWEEGKVSMTTSQRNLLAGGMPLSDSENQKFSKMNARTVEFIAKAGKEEELRKRFNEGVLDLLKRQIGFSGIFILSSHK